MVCPEDLMFRTEHTESTERNQDRNTVCSECAKRPEYAGKGLAFLSVLRVLRANDFMLSWENNG